MTVEQPTLVILVGPPGSGKSTEALRMQEMGFTRISQDDSGKGEHWELFEYAVDKQRPIVVDRMNFSKEQRARYIEPARAMGYKIEIRVLQVPYSECLRRMEERFGTELHPTIRDVESARGALHTFFSKYERPLPEEADSVKFRSYGDDELKGKCIIVDLDGTLCNLDHRLHYVRGGEGEKKDWKRFFERCYLDSPNKWCVELIEGLVRPDSSDLSVVFCSGRPEDLCREQTEKWLDKYCLPEGPLVMRRGGDYRRDDIVKEIILDFEILPRYNILFAVDDRKQVVDLWRRRGIVCLDCAGWDG